MGYPTSESNVINLQASREGIIGSQNFTGIEWWKPFVFHVEGGKQWANDTVGRKKISEICIRTMDTTAAVVDQLKVIEKKLRLRFTDSSLHQGSSHNGA